MNLCACIQRRRIISFEKRLKAIRLEADRLEIQSRDAVADCHNLERLIDEFRSGQLQLEGDAPLSSSVAP